MSPARRAALRRFLPLVVLLCLALIAALTLREHLTFDTLRANREALLAFRDAHLLLAIGGFMLAYTVIVALSLPASTLSMLTGGFLFGLFPGVVMNVISATLGAMVIFAVVRAGIGVQAAALIHGSNGTVRRITDGIRANEVPVLIGMRLVPVIPFFVANVLPAFLGVALGRFAWTTLVGIIPSGMVFTWVGAGLGEVFDRDEVPDLGVIFAPHILGPLLALLALAFMPALLRRVRSTGRDAPPW